MNNKKVNIEAIRVISEGLEVKLDELLTPSIKTVNNVFMPLSDHPNIYGLRIKSFFKEYFRDDLNSLKIDCHFDNLEATSIAISISTYLFELSYNFKNNKLNFFCNGTKLANLPLSNRFVFILRIIDGKLYLAVNNRRFITLDDNIYSIIQKGLVLNNLGKGDVYLTDIQAIYLDHTYHYKYFGFQNDKETKLLYSTAPKYVLEWERRTKDFYTTLVTCYQLLNYKEYLAKGLIDKITRYASSVYNTLMGWPKWRPSSGILAGSSVWETNNWSNGYAPGAFSISCKILQINNNIVKQKFFEQGTAYFLDKRGVTGLGVTQVFPSITHWINRSTNHGIVILVTYLLGSLLLEGKITQTVKVIYEDLKEIVNSSLKDGSYLESISYFQFIILELSIFLYYLSQTEKLTILDVVERDFPSLKKCEEYLMYTTNPNTQKYFANYGDCEATDEWLYPIKTFFKSIFHTLPFDTSKFHTELYSIFSLSYEDNRSENNFLLKKDVTQHFFKANSFYSFQNNLNKYYLWINGSKLHKTHNKDNDRGSFYLSDQFGKIFVKRQGRSIGNHNLLLVDSYKDNGNEIYVSVDKVKEYNFAREANGQLNIVYEDSEVVCLQINLINYFSFEDKNLLSKHVRYYYISKSCDFYLLLVDFYESKYDISVKSVFHLDDTIECKLNDQGIIRHDRFNMECSNNSYISYDYDKNKLEVQNSNLSRKGHVATIISSSTKDFCRQKIIDEFQKKIGVVLS